MCFQIPHDWDPSMPHAFFPLFPLRYSSANYPDHQQQTLSCWYYQQRVIDGTVFVVTASCVTCHFPLHGKLNRSADGHAPIKKRWRQHTQSPIGRLMQTHTTCTFTGTDVWWHTEQTHLAEKWVMRMRRKDGTTGREKSQTNGDMEERRSGWEEKEERGEKKGGEGGEGFRWCALVPPRHLVK